MSSLPAEILQLTFSFLVQRDQVECMTVCHQWNDIIEHHNLFRVVYIHRERQFYQFVDKVKRDPSLGEKVERLTIALDLYANSSDIDLVKLFPNLRHFSMFGSNVDYTNTKPVKPHENHPWCEKIEEIEELYSDKNTRTLLLSGLCKNLTFIVATADRCQSARSLIESLSNATALNELHLHGYYVSFDDIELIHEKVPLLTSLRLIDILPESYTIPLNIKPATLMRSFYCYSCIVDKYSQPSVYLDYVTKKYTHLEELVVELPVTELLPDAGYDNFLDVMNDRNATMGDHMYSLGPQLKALTVVTYIPDEETCYSSFDLTMMDECECQLEKLNLNYPVGANDLEMQSNATQNQYIQSLTINISKDSVSGESIRFGWLTHFIQLKKLSINFAYNSKLYGRRKMNIRSLLNTLGDKQLETLYLSYVTLETDSSSDISKYPSLKRLTLSDVVMDEHADLFISRVLPNLTYLKLDKCCDSRKSYTFTYTNLCHLEISNTFPNMVFPVLVITLDNSQQRLYARGISVINTQLLNYGFKKDVFSSPSVSSEPFDESSSSSPLLTITCNSIKDFYIYNCRETLNGTR